MWKVILLIILFLIYLRSPIDLLPDLMGPIGFLDDIGLFALLWWYVRKLLRERLQPPEEQPPHQEGEDRNEKRPLPPHEVLGVSVGATQSEIEKAYKKRIREYHPDQVHQLGKELQQVAREKTQEINSAYETLKKRIKTTS